MRLTDLLGTEVRDADDAVIGRVLDLRLVQDGPTPAAGARLRVDGLLVGRGRRGALAVRLGYHRDDQNGPFLLNGLARLLERGVRYVPWSAVSDGGDEVLRVPDRAQVTLLRQAAR